MEHQFNCLRCGKLSVSVRAKSQKKPKYCSRECFHPQSIEFKKQKAISLYNKYVEKKPVGCWGWKGYIGHDGYARFKTNGKMKIAHRFSYEQMYGPIPKEMVVAHKCDEKKCTRPECLIAVKPKYNSADMVLKDRQAKGSKNGSAKLTEAQVKQIKKDISDSIPDEFIQILNDISRDQFRRIKLGKNWTHVTLDDAKPLIPPLQHISN